MPASENKLPPDLERVVCIVHLYRLLLNRPVDRGGLLHHAERLAQGESLEAMAASLLQTEEGRKAWASTPESGIARTVWDTVWPTADAERHGFEAAWAREPDLPALLARLVRGEKARSAPVLEALFPEGVDPAAEDVYPAWAYGLWTLEVERALSAAARRLLPVLRLAGPTIGLVIELAPGDRAEDLDATVASLSRQIYGRWRLTLRGPLPVGFTLPRDQRITGSGRPDDLPDGSWIGWLRPGDTLSPAALALLGYAVRRRPWAAAIYSDEDRRGRDGSRAAPLLKPAWDPVEAAQADSAGSLCLFAARRLRRLGGARPGLDAHARLRLATARLASARVVHLPAVLCHRLHCPVPAPDKADPVPDPPPPVSVVIATRDRPDLLERCVRSVRACTDYPSVEIVLVDNGSIDSMALALLDRFRREGCVVLSRPGPFNWSALNNDGVRAASGRIVVLMNNDIECVEPGWLWAMVRACLWPGAGAVGAVLHYADGTIQHAGVVVGPGAQAAHLRNAGDARTPPVRNLSAVTGACMAFRRSVFDRMGGLDPALPVTWNDIDFCLRVRQAGLHVMLAREARLLHDELGTRTPDSDASNQPQLLRSRALIAARHAAALGPDPFFNPLLTARSGGLCLDPQAPARLWPIVLAGGRQRN